LPQGDLPIALTVPPIAFKLFTIRGAQIVIRDEQNRTASSIQMAFARSPLTQHISLKGENALAFVEDVQQAFALSIAPV
jgi:hypothetical protein